MRLFYRVAGLLCIAVVVPTLAFGQSAGATLPKAPPPTAPAKAAERPAVATELRSVRVEQVDGGYAVTLAGNGALPGASVGEADLPSRLLLDFRRVSVGSAPAVTDVQNEHIDRVRVAIHSRNPLITRVVIDLTRRLPFTIEQRGDEVRVLLKPLVDTTAVAPPAANRTEAPAVAVPATVTPVLPNEAPVTGPPAPAMPEPSRPAPAVPSSPVAALLFRVFLSDGRVLSSYGEWARLGDRVIFSMPTQLTRDPIELQLVTIPAQRVDWPRTESYAESVRAAAYVASRGDDDFLAFSTDLAKVLNEVANIQDPAARLATAERARQKLDDWPRSHYGYRVGEVRDALAVLDEVIAQLRLSMGITRFDLSLSANAPLPAPPPPPLPPPSDAELVEQFAAAAAVADSPDERVSLLQTVMRLIDRAVGLMPAEWAARMRGTTGDELERERRAEKAYDELRTRTLEDAAKLASRGNMSDLERLRDRVREEDRRLGGQRPGDIASLLATIDLQTAAVIGAREARNDWRRRAPIHRRYRRSTNGAFKVFSDALPALEQIKAMSGPPANGIASLTKRLSAAGRNFIKVIAPPELASGHAMAASAWELADRALRLRLDAVSANSVDVAQRASSAAAGALMLYQRARADQRAIMEPPATK